MHTEICVQDYAPTLPKQTIQKGNKTKNPQMAKRKPIKKSKKKPEDDLEFQEMSSLMDQLIRSVNQCTVLLIQLTYHARNSLAAYHLKFLLQWVWMKRFRPRKRREGREVRKIAKSPKKKKYYQSVRIRSPAQQCKCLSVSMNDLFCWYLIWSFICWTQN